MTTVVNIKKTKCYDVYCGRGSIYGNPFKIGEDGDRKEVIQKFKKYFYKRLKDKKFKNDVLFLKEKILGCYCKPLDCHCDVIKEYLDNLYLENYLI